MIVVLSLIVLLITMTQISMAENIKSRVSVSGDSITLSVKRSIIKYMMSPIVFCVFFIMIVSVVKGEGLILFIGFLMFMISSYALIVKGTPPISVISVLSFQSLVLILLGFFNS